MAVIDAAVGEVVAVEFAAIVHERGVLDPDAALTDEELAAAGTHRVGVGAPVEVLFLGGAALGRKLAGGAVSVAVAGLISVAVAGLISVAVASWVTVAVAGRVAVAVAGGRGIGVAGGAFADVVVAAVEVVLVVRVTPLETDAAHTLVVAVEFVVRSAIARGDLLEHAADTDTEAEHGSK